MPQSLAQIYLHIVFSTKDRRPFLKDAALRNGMFAYMVGILNGAGCTAIKIGGVEDHVHILCRFGRTVTIADLIRDLKRDTTKWIKENGRGMDQFQWQGGYAAFSISPSHISPLVTYTEGQVEHHRVEGFQEELLRLLKKYGSEFDERFLWD